MLKLIKLTVFNIITVNKIVNVFNKILIKLKKY